MKPLIIANWKMNFTSVEAEKTTKQILQLLIKEKIDPSKAEIVLAPSFAATKTVAQLIKKSGLKIGAQDCSWLERGSLTGEVSPLELKEIGVQYVIIGHSERRENLAETDEIISQKIKAALKVGLIPVLCVGETFKERQRGIKDYKIIQQVCNALKDNQLTIGEKIIIAYEPVWVIGSGQAVAPEEAFYTIQVIEQAMTDLIGPLLVKKISSFIYGGSIDENNIKSFVKDKISGVLVGGASLKAEQLVKLIKIL